MGTELLNRLRRRTAYAALAVAASAALCSPARAIVSSSSPSDWLAGGDSRFGGEAELIINHSTGCSGSLLSGGAYVLTAAHCVTGTNSGAVTANNVVVNFKGGTVTASVSAASQISVFTTWAGAGTNGVNLGQNNDLALLRLDTAVNGISGYQVFANDPLGSTVVLAGYGYSGTGISGYQTGTFGVLHWGENQYDVRYDTAGSYLFDFDDGTSARNALALFPPFTSSTGLPAITPPGSSPEAMIAPGDSGGASFIVASGNFYLAGVHSFGARLNAGDTDIDKTLDGSFGEIGGDTALYTASNVDWIRAVTGITNITAVPEPASYAMLLAGGVGLLVRVRRTARRA